MQAQLCSVFAHRDAMEADLSLEEGGGAHHDTDACGTGLSGETQCAAAGAASSRPPGVDAIDTRGGRYFKYRPPWAPDSRPMEHMRSGSRSGLTVLVRKTQELHGGMAPRLRPKAQVRLIKGSWSSGQWRSRRSRTRRGGTSLLLASSLPDHLVRSGLPSMGEHGYGQPTVGPSGRARRPCRRRVRGDDHGEGAARGNAHVRVRPELHQRRVNTSLPTATPAGHARGLAWKSGRTPAMARDHAAIDREYMTMRSIPLLGERGQHLRVWHVEIEKMMRRTPNVVGLWQCYFFLQIIQ